MKLVAAGSAVKRSANAEASSFDRAKKSFLAAMSHELRTPLNAIIGFAEVMDAQILGPIPTAEYRDYVRHILGSSRHLLRIIEDVLEISQAEAGELVLGKREVDLAELVNSAVHPFDAQCLARKIRVVKDLPDHLVILVDPERVRRAISSLLSNAIKFSRDDSEIHISAKLRGEDRVVITIRDSGIGMEPSTIEQAFAPFIQLQDKLSRPFEGSGLGLPLARLLVELHGGNVQLETSPGVGTKAILELPAYSRSLSQWLDRQ